jgi:LysR family glycine cleavage system transcriptional activator
VKHKLPPLSALRAFDAASRRENFAKAADDLFVSHSAISQQIRVLEEWLQVKLFVRLGNRVALTDEGRALRPRVSEAFELMAEACAYASRTTEEKSMIVSAEPAFATRWLRPRLTEFRSANPDLSVYLNVSWDQNSPNSSNTDIVIHFESRFNESMVNVDRLFPIDGYPACSPTFLKENSDIRNPSDICHYPLIHDNSRMIWRRWFDRFVPGSDAWEKGYVYSDLSLAIDAALDGEGIFLADDILCAQEISSGTLVKALPETLRCVWYCIAVSSERGSDPIIRTFIDWIVKAIANDI